MIKIPCFIYFMRNDLGVFYITNIYRVIDDDP
jgi:hypothetical protein